MELLLLQARCSQLSLWFFSSGVQEARKALWMTRLGVLVKEKARVTWRAYVVRWSDVEMTVSRIHFTSVQCTPQGYRGCQTIIRNIRTMKDYCTTDPNQHHTLSL